MALEEVQKSVHLGRSRGRVRDLTATTTPSATFDTHLQGGRGECVALLAKDLKKSCQSRHKSSLPVGTVLQRARWLRPLTEDRQNLAHTMGYLIVEVKLLEDSKN